MGPHHASPGRLRIPTLDGWRAVAISLVLLGHASDEMARAAAGWGLRVHVPPEIGLFGVRVFFAISGYLITTNLLEEEQVRGDASMASFYVRRAFRILPAACTFLLVIAALTALGVLDVAPSRWLATLCLLSNYTDAPASWYLGHFWSLAIEEHFYLAWPLLFVLLARPRRRLAFAALAVLAVWLWRAIAFKYHLTWSSIPSFWARTDLQVDGILCGVTLALARRIPAARERLDRLLAQPLALPALALALAALDVSAAWGWKSAMAAASLRSAVLPLLILCTVLRPQGAVGRLLETRWARWLGAVSYSLYLWQQLFLVWDSARVPVLKPLQNFPLGLVAAFTCAWASFAFVERPLIALGRRWSGSAVPRAVPAAPH